MRAVENCFLTSHVHKEVNKVNLSAHCRKTELYVLNGKSLGSVVFPQRETGKPSVRCMNKSQMLPIIIQDNALALIQS